MLKSKPRFCPAVYRRVDHELWLAFALGALLRYIILLQRGLLGKMLDIIVYCLIVLGAVTFNLKSFLFHFVISNLFLS